MSKKKQNRKKSMEVRRKQQKWRKWIRIIIWPSVFILLFGGLYMINKIEQSQLPGTLVPSQGNRHIDTPETQHEPYNSNPPTSGPHVPYLADWGVYKEPIPKEVLIHNLEDGGVVIYYNGQADEKIVNELEELVSSYSTKVVLMPDTDLEDLITLTAWQRIDRLNEFDKNRIIEFIEAFRGIDHH
jgi:hypothetical protein